MSDMNSNLEDDIFSSLGTDLEDTKAPECEHSTLPATAKERFLLAKQNYMKEVRKYAESIKKDPNIILEDADIRFSTSLPLNRIRNMSIAIVGAGGIGNWQWRTLLGMGFQNIVIFDDDKVGLENIGPQAHSLLDIDMYKVDAVRDAALQYRGISIATVHERVYTLSGIIEKIGYTPDIVITCTDSTEFRNGFIKDLFTGTSYNPCMYSKTPRLILDYRMSLGDWTCYATPFEKISYASCRDTLALKYYNEAVFPHEAAVQEPCTERAIVYTGMNVASYTGAILHWFITKFEPECSDREETKKALIKFYNNGLQFGWKKTFSARDFEQITVTHRERVLRKRLSESENIITKLESRLGCLVSAAIGREVVSESNPKIGDYLVYIDCDTFKYHRILATEPGRCISSLCVVDDGKYHVVEHTDENNTYGEDAHPYSALNGYTWTKRDEIRDEDFCSTLPEHLKCEDNLVDMFRIFQNADNNPKIPVRVWSKGGVPLDVFGVDLRTGKITSCSGKDAHKYKGMNFLDMLFEEPNTTDSETGESDDYKENTNKDTPYENKEEVKDEIIEASNPQPVVYDKHWDDIRVKDIVEFADINDVAIRVESVHSDRIIGHTNDGEKTLIRRVSLSSERVRIL